MNIEPVAYFHSPLPEKFGIPRQSGLVPQLKGEIRLVEKYRRPEALRGLDGFDWIWLIWEFDRNSGEGSSLTVRPPRLGGNERIGVFASRSPFRPNGLGLSSVHIESVDFENGIIHVNGADLADGTPIYDIKPYIKYADCHTDAAGGFVDENNWRELEVRIPGSVLKHFTREEAGALEGILAQDPRPKYQDNPTKEYGLAFAGRNIRFRVQDSVLEVLEG